MLGLGIALQLLSCFLAALGYVLQKSAHVLREGVPDPGPIWRSWRWLLGLTSMIVSAGAAVGSAPLVPTLTFTMPQSEPRAETNSSASRRSFVKIDDDSPCGTSFWSAMA